MSKPQAIQVAPSKPVVRYGDSLHSLEAGAFVHVNRQGQVVSARRRRLRKRLAIGYLVCAPFLVALTTGLWAGLGIGALASLGLWRIQRGKAMVQALALLGAQDVEGTIAALRTIEKRRWQGKRSRALLQHNLSVCYLMQGQASVALEHSNCAADLLAQTRGFHKRLLWNFIVPHRMVVLANLGRLEEARKVLDELDRSFINSSDVLRHQFWTSELYIAFVEGSHHLDAEELFKRARFALEMTNPRALLALTAWAHSVLGDEEQAQHLAKEALERPHFEVETMMPALWSWVSAHAQ